MTIDRTLLPDRCKPLSLSVSREAVSEDRVRSRPVAALAPLQAWRGLAARCAHAMVGADDPILHELADIVAGARDPGEIELALVRLARKMSGARSVELIRDEGTEPRRVACWPEPEPGSAEESDGEGLAPSYLPLWMPLRFGDQALGTLRLVSDPRRQLRWTPRLVRRMTTLCAIAAAAGRGLYADRTAEIATEPRWPVAALHDTTFLNAILPYALGQAKRHHEPLSLLCVAVDRLAAIRKLHGREFSGAAVQRVSQTITATLRASDVVARLDDDRIIAVLPDASAIHSARVAEFIREAIEASCGATANLPKLTASIGMACFPTHAHDVHSLIAAADAALVRAERMGRNRVASPVPGSAAPVALAHIAG